MELPHNEISLLSYLLLAYGRRFKMAHGFCITLNV